MLKISTRGRYGARLMLDLAVNRKNSPLPLKDISKRQGISEGYLEHIVPSLKYAGLISSVRGTGGGYKLAKDIKNISLGEIIRAVEDTSNTVQCIKSPEFCTRVDNCVTHDIWKKIDKDINTTLNNTSLEQMLRKYWKKNNRKIQDYSLYLVSSEEYSSGRGTLEVAKEAACAGIDIFQMREKSKPGEELLSLGKELKRICEKNNIVFIVNDKPGLAKELDADGVHLGQEDIAEYTVKEVRDIIGRDKIIGVSTHSIEQFKTANDQDIDYIAFGPVFPTGTKDYTIGTGRIKEVINLASKPVVFIGGINIDNMSEILEMGAKNIAVIRAITGADNIAETVKCFKTAINKSIKQKQFKS